MAGRSLTFPGGIEDIWEMLKSTCPALLAVPIIPSLPFVAATVLRMLNDTPTTQILFFAAEYSCSIWLILAVCHYVVVVGRNERAHPFRSAAISLTRLPHGLSVGVLIWLLFGGGVFLLVIPGLWILSALFLAMPALVMERIGPSKAIRRALILSAGNRLAPMLVLATVIGLNLGLLAAMYTLSIPRLSFDVEYITAAGSPKEGPQLGLAWSALAAGPWITTLYWIGVALMMILLFSPAAVLILTAALTGLALHGHSIADLRNLVKVRFFAVCQHLRLIIVVTAISSFTVASGYLAANLTTLGRFYPDSILPGLELIPAWAGWMFSQGIWGMYMAVSYLTLTGDRP